MIDIGTFVDNNRGGFIGSLTTLGISAELTLEPFESQSEKAPDFRVLHQGREVGGAWRRQSKTGVPFFNVTIADPGLPCTIRACLFQPRKPKATEWPLVWDRGNERG